MGELKPWAKMPISSPLVENWRRVLSEQETNTVSDGAEFSASASARSAAADAVAPSIGSSGSPPAHARLVKKEANTAHAHRFDIYMFLRKLIQSPDDPSPLLSQAPCPLASHPRTAANPGGARVPRATIARTSAKLTGGKPHVGDIAIDRISERAESARRNSGRACGSSGSALTK